MTTSGPTPSVRSLTCSNRSSAVVLLASIVCVAPIRLATSSRLAFRSVAMISPAPVYLKAATVISPIGPTPSTATLFPMLYPSPMCGIPGARARSIARVATAAGSVIIARSDDRPSGILNAFDRPCMYIYSANPPSRCGEFAHVANPYTIRSEQSAGLCGKCTQLWHFPHPFELGVVVIRSPTCSGPPITVICSFAFGPISTTVPTNSCPGIKGKFSLDRPICICLSLPHTPTFSISNSSPSSSTFGRSNS